MRQLLTRYWFHFSSLVSDRRASCCWGYLAACCRCSGPIGASRSCVSFLRRDTALWPRPSCSGALADGSMQALNVAATCAGAGIIVGVVTLTGLA